MKTRLFILIFALVASAGTLFAESGTLGDNATWNYADGVLTISRLFDGDISSGTLKNLKFPLEIF